MTCFFINRQQARLFSIAISVFYFFVKKFPFIVEYSTIVYIFILDLHIVKFARGKSRANFYTFRLIRIN